MSCETTWKKKKRIHNQESNNNSIQSDNSSFLSKEMSLLLEQMTNKKREGMSDFKVADTSTGDSSGTNKTNSFMPYVNKFKDDGTKKIGKIINAFIDLILSPLYEMDKTNEKILTTFLSDNNSTTKSRSNPAKIKAEVQEIKAFIYKLLLTPIYFYIAYNFYYILFFRKDNKINEEDDDLEELSCEEIKLTDWDTYFDNNTYGPYIKLITEFLFKPSKIVFIVLNIIKSYHRLFSLNKIAPYIIFIILFCNISINSTTFLPYLWSVLQKLYKFKIDDKIYNYCSSVIWTCFAVSCFFDFLLFLINPFNYSNVVSMVITLIKFILKIIFWIIKGFVTASIIPMSAFLLIVYIIFIAFFGISFKDIKYMNEYIFASLNSEPETEVIDDNKDGIKKGGGSLLSKLNTASNLQNKFNSVKKLFDYDNKNVINKLESLEDDKPDYFDDTNANYEIYKMIITCFNLIPKKFYKVSLYLLKMLFCYLFEFIFVVLILKFLKNINSTDSSNLQFAIMIIYILFTIVMLTWIYYKYETVQKNIDIGIEIKESVECEYKLLESKQKLKPFTEIMHFLKIYGIIVTITKFILQIAPPIKDFMKKVTKAFGIDLKNANADSIKERMSEKFPISPDVVNNVLDAKNTVTKQANTAAKALEVVQGENIPFVDGMPITELLPGALQGKTLPFVNGIDVLKGEVPVIKENALTNLIGSDINKNMEKYKKSSADFQKKQEEEKQRIYDLKKSLD